MADLWVDGVFWLLVFYLWDFLLVFLVAADVGVQQDKLQIDLQLSPPLPPSLVPGISSSSLFLPVKQD